jgi:hypothetical protein
MEDLSSRFLSSPNTRRAVAIEHNTSAAAPQPATHTGYIRNHIADFKIPPPGIELRVFRRDAESDGAKTTINLRRS